MDIADQYDRISLEIYRICPCIEIGLVGECYMQPLCADIELQAISSEGHPLDASHVSVIHRQARLGQDGLNNAELSIQAIERGSGRLTESLQTTNFSLVRHNHCRVNRGGNDCPLTSAKPERRIPRFSMLAHASDCLPTAALCVPGCSTRLCVDQRSRLGSAATSELPGPRGCRRRELGTGFLLIYVFGANGRPKRAKD